MLSCYKLLVDYLFCFVGKLVDYEKVVVIMIGMGSDGIVGLKDMFMVGNVKVIVEFEEFCVVYGMLKVVVKVGFIYEIKYVEDIVVFIISCVKKERV